MKKPGSTRASNMFHVLCPSLVVMVLVCGGLSQFCPMVQSAAAETPLHASPTDHTMGTGCQDALGSYTTQLDNAHLCAHQMMATIPLDHDPPALRINVIMSFAPSNPARYTFLCTFLL